MFLNPVDLKGSLGSVLHHISKGLEKMDFTPFLFIHILEKDQRGGDCSRRRTH